MVVIALSSADDEIEQATDGVRVGKEMRLTLAVLSVMGDAVTIAQARDQRTLFVNRAFERLTGRRAEEMLGRPLLSILPRGSGFRERMGEVQAELGRRGYWEGEIEERAADGSSSLARLRIIAYESPEYGALWVSVRQDVTERRRAETRYRALVDNLPAVVYNAEQGVEGSWSFVSPQIERMLGFTPDEWQADPTLWKKRIHPDDAERVLEVESQVGQNRQLIDEYRMLARNGDVVWVQDTAMTPLPGAQEGPPEWHGVLLDVTEQKKAETRYQALVDSVPAVVYVNDAKVDGYGQWSFVSGQIESMLGYSPDEWKADPTLWRRSLHPDDAERQLAAEASQISDRKAIPTQYRMLTRDGAVVWVQDSSVLRPGAPGGPPEWHGVLLDVTELHRTKQAVEEAHYETITRLAMAIERRDIETSAHIERMSHYCELISRALGLSDERRELIRVASSLHDVGKISVPDEVLLKPGKLTAAERAEVERHAEIGYEVLRGGDSVLLELAATIALTHHERFDGGGYPRGLAGEEIALEGRIAAVADVFDALSTDRVYRPAFPLDETLEMMRSERGRHFDPVVLDAFLGNLEPVVEIVSRSGAAA